MLSSSPISSTHCSFSYSAICLWFSYNFNLDIYSSPTSIFRAVVCNINRFFFSARCKSALLGIASLVNIYNLCWKNVVYLPIDTQSTIVSGNLAHTAKNRKLQHKENVHGKNRNFSIRCMLYMLAV